MQKQLDVSQTTEDRELLLSTIQVVLENISEGLIITDQSGYVRQVNKTAQKILGFNTSELVGKKFISVVKAYDENGAELTPKQRSIPQIPRTKSPMCRVLVYGTKNGAMAPTQATLSPIQHGGKTIGGVEAFRDITHEKEMDKAKIEFVSLASHQLRTPLSTISWYTEMLLAGDAGKVNDEQNKYLEEIYNSNRRMIELVSSLLNVSRIDLGTFVIEPVPTDLIKLAKDVVKDLEPRIFARKIDFQETYAAKMLTTNVDPKLTRMVIENLASNAIKYTPERGRVELSIAKRGNQIKIVVTDTGYGIPESQQDKIFTKLFRADNAKKQDTEGTGLGLYIVKSIVEISGGKIWFTSIENKGTTFSVNLPFAGMKKKAGTKTLD